MLNHTHATKSKTQSQDTPTTYTITPIHTQEVTTSENPVTIIHPAAMSGIAESVKDVTSPLGKAVGSSSRPQTEQAENPPQQPQTPQQQQQGGRQSAPRSMPDISESQLGDEEGSSGDNEGEMVPAAGRINERGEVIDDDGTPIGKVTDGEASRFAGYVVTQEGDILDEDGGVVGKAEPLEDTASNLNYTTQSARDNDTDAGEQQQQRQRESGDDHGGTPSSGHRSGLGGIADTAGSAVGDVAGGVADTAGSAISGVTGGAGKTAEGATEAAGDTAEEAPEAAEDATGTEHATDAVGDTAKEATDAAGDATGAEDVTGAVGDAAKSTADTAGDAAEGVTGAVEDKAEDATEEIKEGSAGDIPDGATEELKEGTAGDAAEGAPQEVKDFAEGGAPSVDQGSKAEGSKAQGLTEQQPIPIREIPSLSPSVANKIVAMFDGPFTIADGGKVMDQSGKVLGKLADGSDIQDLIGKEVKGIDEKGNLLGEDNTVLGKVDIAPEGSMAERIKEEIPEAAERLDALKEAQQEVAPIQIPSFAPSVAGKVIDMFEGPFNIAEDGQVTDQNGKILGKLAEGQDFENLVGKDIKGIDERGNLLGDNNTQLGKVDLAPEGTIVERIKDQIPEAAERLDAIDAAKQQAEETKLPNISILEGLKINKMGNIIDANGNVVGKVKSGELKKLVGRMPDKEGKVWDDRGNVIGEVEVLPEAVKNEASPFEDFPDATVDKFGKVIFEGRQVGVVVGDDWTKLIGKKVDAEGDILDKNGNVVGHAERQEEEEPEEPQEEEIDYSMLKDKKVNKLGNVVDDKGEIWGYVVQGVVKNLVGKKVGDKGQIFNDAGKVIGQAEPIPEGERQEAKEPAPFEDFPDAVVGDNGDVIFNGEKVGVVVEGDAKKLKGKPVDADGDILDKAGNTLGRAERWEPEPEPEEPEIDMSSLAGKRINKAGNAVDSHGDIYGRVIEGQLSRLIGKMCDKNGFIRNEGGDVIGKCELIPEAEREGMKEGPFTELTGCTVRKDGKVVTAGGDVVGRLVSGDPKALAGRPVDDDGDICDRNGNVLGKAERWEEPEVEKEVNPMSGRRVNREGNVVDENGDVIGKLTSGDLSKCAGKKIDDDGDVLDQKGTAVGHCSLLEEIPEKKDVSPMSGRRVNREGNVVDENGDVIGKLTSGELSQCIGKKIDDDGDVVDSKGTALGHCSVLAEIPEEPEPEPEPEPEQESEEDREKRLRIEQDRKIASQICYCITQSLDKIKPICRMIVERINQEEAKSEADRDEEELIKQVRPLIEEGGKILTEANGVIRGLDPDGRISAQAKHHSAGHEATPEEYQLAELLKELTGTVTETIENAKRKLENLPKAKKGINPLWGLLSEPLFQIIAAVGLLLSGVLGLVGKLLNGLGLGGLVNNLLGGLGLTKVLDGLGLGTILAPITGGKKK
ncbi:hypothetical protein F5B17DRAFT_293759 [Nemania serpens]|nr:hypothetical protein F5B17DRAFT_293759 [Nemania serpens]